MTQQNYYENINHVISFTSENVSSCELCGASNNFQETLNHYISQHGYKLLHVGTQSSLHSNGNLVHDVVVVLGK